jgi:hypothetical protein
LKDQNRFSKRKTKNHAITVELEEQKNIQAEKKKYVREKTFEVFQLQNEMEKE